MLLQSHKVQIYTFVIVYKTSFKEIKKADSFKQRSQSSFSLLEIHFFLHVQYFKQLKPALPQVHVVQMELIPLHLQVATNFDNAFESLSSDLCHFICS